MLDTKEPDANDAVHSKYSPRTANDAQLINENVPRRNKLNLNTGSFDLSEFSRHLEAVDEGKEFIYSPKEDELKVQE